MLPGVENLKTNEEGEQFVAEADFLAHHITVRCVYDEALSSWIPAVFRSNNMGETHLMIFTPRLKAFSRLGAAHMGIRYALTQLMFDGKAPLPTPADTDVLLGLCSGFERAQQDDRSPLS